MNFITTKINFVSNFLVVNEKITREFAFFSDLIKFYLFTCVSKIFLIN